MNQIILSNKLRNDLSIPSWSGKCYYDEDGDYRHSANKEKSSRVTLSSTTSSLKSSSSRNGEASKIYRGIFNHRPKPSVATPSLSSSSTSSSHYNFNQHLSYYPHKHSDKSLYLYQNNNREKSPLSFDNLWNGNQFDEHLSGDCPHHENGIVDSQIKSYLFSVSNERDRINREVSCHTNGNLNSRQPLNNSRIKNNTKVNNHHLQNNSRHNGRRDPKQSNIKLSDEQPSDYTEDDIQPFAYQIVNQKRKKKKIDILSLNDPYLRSKSLKRMNDIHYLPSAHCISPANERHLSKLTIFNLPNKSSNIKNSYANSSRRNCNTNVNSSNNNVNISRRNYNITRLNDENDFEHSSDDDDFQEKKKKERTLLHHNRQTRSIDISGNDSDSSHSQIPHKDQQTDEAHRLMNNDGLLKIRAIPSQIKQINFASKMKELKPQTSVGELHSTENSLNSTFMTVSPHDFPSASKTRYNLNDLLQSSPSASSISSGASLKHNKNDENDYRKDNLTSLITPSTSTTERTTNTCSSSSPSIRSYLFTTAMSKITPVNSLPTNSICNLSQKSNSNSKMINSPSSSIVNREKRRYGTKPSYTSQISFPTSSNKPNLPIPNSPRTQPTFRSQLEMNIKEKRTRSRPANNRDCMKKQISVSPQKLIPLEKSITIPRKRFIGNTQKEKVNDFRLKSQQDGRPSSQFPIVSKSDLRPLPFNTNYKSDESKKHQPLTKQDSYSKTTILPVITPKLHPNNILPHKTIASESIVPNNVPSTVSDQLTNCRKHHTYQRSQTDRLKINNNNRNDHVTNFRVNDKFNETNLIERRKLMLSRGGSHDTVMSHNNNDHHLKSNDSPQTKPYTGVNMRALRDLFESKTVKNFNKKKDSSQIGRGSCGKFLPDAFNSMKQPNDEHLTFRQQASQMTTNELRATTGRTSQREKQYALISPSLKLKNYRSNVSNKVRSENTNGDIMNNYLFSPKSPLSVTKRKNRNDSHPIRHIIETSKNSCNETIYSYKKAKRKNGEVEVIKDGKRLVTMEPCHVFGELAILYNCARTASIKATTACELWGIDRDTFQIIMMQSGLERHDRNVKLLLEVPKLRDLPETVIHQMADTLEEVTYEPEEFVAREGSRSDTFFIVSNGSAIQFTNSCPANKKMMNTGEFFGIQALFKEVTREANVVAGDDGVQCLILDRQMFSELVDTDILDFPSESSSKQSSKKSSVASTSYAPSNRIASSTTVKDTIQEESSPRYPSSNNELVVDVSIPDRSIPNDIDSRKSSLTPEMHSALQSQKESLNESTLFNSIHLNNLEVIGTLGVGGFGRVELVKLMKKLRNGRNELPDGYYDKTYALKQMKKIKILDAGQEEHVLNERKILELVNCPYIIKLFRTYKDKKYLYMLTEVCLGGELWSLLREKASFDDGMTRFYASCVIEAFDYLHSRHIIYRDLKPENLLLAANGYVKLVDFGFAKQLRKGRKTWTFCGTPEYVSPEILLNKGHDRSTDLWALGILIFEMLTGRPPFVGSDPMSTYQKIIKGIDTADFPRKISRVAQILIKRLCRDNPVERVGYKRGGFEEIRRHRFFDTYNWNALQSCTLQAPYIPKIADMTDLSNFEEYPDDTDEPEDEVSGWDKDF
ncbi:hypothetical protein SNEBB_010390 [Seison nebaliae]|nr:hypothetical protein SNEBB_010390 [Seison nebaliae]